MVNNQSFRIITYSPTSIAPLFILRPSSSVGLSPVNLLHYPVKVIDVVLILFKMILGLTYICIICINIKTHHTEGTVILDHDPNTIYLTTTITPYT
jgi:hypothetical protein